MHSLSIYQANFFSKNCSIFQLSKISYNNTIIFFRNICCLFEKKTYKNNCLHNSHTKDIIEGFTQHSLQYIPLILSNSTDAPRRLETFYNDFSLLLPAIDNGAFLWALYTDSLSFLSRLKRPKYLKLQIWFSWSRRA